MSSEQRLDRLERMLLLVVKAGARERKAIRKGVSEAREGVEDAGEKINALIDAQMRHEEAYAQSKRRTDEAMVELARVQAETREELSRFGRRTDEEMVRLTRVQAETAESLKALIATVDRMARERGNGQV
jgi:hypothetical protein